MDKWLYFLVGKYTPAYGDRVSLHREFEKHAKLIFKDSG
jgi:hypothetical protein